MKMDDSGKVSKRKRTFNSFFAGIGGFDLALEREGFGAAAQCEIDTFCQGVLASHWPQVTLFDDITKIDPSSLPQADVWCGGFPCQDVSVARGSNKRDGLAGKNSGLFFSFLELVRSRKPDTILLENVVGLLSSHNGQDFRVVVEELTSLGYAVAWRVMNSRYFGSPQSRPRVFVCASRTSAELPIKVLYEDKPGRKPTGVRDGFLRDSRCNSSGAIVAEVAYCLAATSGRHTGTDWSRTYVSYEDAVRRLTPTECEGLQGFPVGWTTNSGASPIRPADEDSLRYKALGNAVSVPVAQWIAKRLKVELSKPRAKSWKSAVNLAPDFKGRTLRKSRLSELHLSEDGAVQQLKWQSGGYAIGDDCWDLAAPPAPNRPTEMKLIEVIERVVPDARYFLSANAAEGILRRVDSQNRTLFGPMDRALRHMVQYGPESGVCLPKSSRRAAA